MKSQCFWCVVEAEKEMNKEEEEDGSNRSGYSTESVRRLFIEEAVTNYQGTPCCGRHALNIYKANSKRK